METNFDLINKSRKYNIPLVWIGAKDQLPKIPIQGCYVCNLDNIYDVNGNLKRESGTHWVSWYIEGKHANYLDSFGFGPPVEVENFLKPYIPYLINNKEIQNINSGYCGDYCLYFLWYMSHNKRIKNVNKRFRYFLEIWNIDTIKNLQILKSQFK